MKFTVVFSIKRVLSTLYLLICFLATTSMINTCCIVKWNHFLNYFLFINSKATLKFNEKYQNRHNFS